MSYVEALIPEHRGYRMVNENDFSKVFSEIEGIVNSKPSVYVEEGVELTKMASTQNDTRNTGAGTEIDVNYLIKIIDSHTR